MNNLDKQALYNYKHGLEDLMKNMEMQEKYKCDQKLEVKKALDDDSYTCKVSYLMRGSLSCSGGIWNINSCEHYNKVDGRCMYITRGLYLK